MSLIPITREEFFLAKLAGQDVSTPAPITRIERYLDIACGNAADIPVPVTRLEIFLAKIAGADVEIPAPVFRPEYYLAAIAGADIAVPAPITRLEQALNEWLNNLFPAEYKKVKGFTFKAATYYLIEDFHLLGSDIVRISFSVNKACNVFGCYTTNSAQDNYSLYASTSAGAKYLRYDGAVYDSYFPAADAGTQYNVVITPNGTSGMPTDSVITPSDFEASADLCIGTTSSSATSSKLDGNIWGSIVVDGRLRLVPCERLSDNVLGYYDMKSKAFYEPIGSAPTSLGDV